MHTRDCEIQAVAPKELGEFLNWLLSFASVERGRWIISQLTARVERKQLGDIAAFRVTRSANVIAGVLAVKQPAAAANLLLAAQDAGIDECEPLLAACDALCSVLRQTGFRFLQASVDGHLDNADNHAVPRFDSENQVRIEKAARQLSALGFFHLANLDILLLNELSTAGSARNGNAQLSFLPVSGSSELLDQLCQIAEQTFEETADCPRLSEFRSAADIVDGYRQAGDPGLWRLAMLGGQAVGCLLLAEHHQQREETEVELPEDHPPEDHLHHTKSGWSGQQMTTMEISYMGLLPSFRGRGLGSQLLAQAVNVARSRGAHQMVLGVDSTNSSAISLYHRFGWKVAAQESVWGRRLND